jgi:outer membrane biosynthesis protein TonB
MPLFPCRDIEGGEGMAFRELQAMQVAYELLSPLDSSAQQRALSWLSAALADENGVTPAVEEPAAPMEVVAEAPAGQSVADAGAEPSATVPDAGPASPQVPDVEPPLVAEPVAVTEPAIAAEPEATITPPEAVEPAPVEPEAVEPAPAPRPRRNRTAKAGGRRAAKAAEAAAATEPAEPAAATEPARATAPAKPAEGTPGRRGERPSGDQFLADLAAAGSFKALAEKYGKSVGTIANWANQLREQGFDIPVGRQKKA